jgi:hypothetical protein
MNPNFITTLFCLLLTIAFAEPNNIEVEALLAQRDHTIEVLRRRVRQLQDDLSEESKTNNRLKWLCRKNGIKIDEDKIEKQMTGEKISKSLFLKVGRIGYMGHDSHGMKQTMQVYQIIDKNNAIAGFTGNYQPNYHYAYGGRAKYPTRYLPVTQTVWLKNIDTSGWIDDKWINIYAPLKVVGTTPYGGSTIFMLEPYIAD